MKRSDTVMNKPFSSNFLKIIAIISMTIDHIGVTLIYPAFIDECMVSGIDLPGDMMPFEAKKLYYLYIATRLIGRIAFPIFAFMIAEGAFKTSDIKKYLSRLLLFAFLSEIPYDLATNGRIFDIGSQNIFWTLSAGLAVIMFIKNRTEMNRSRTVFLTVVLCTVSVFLSFSIGGILLIVSMYIFRYDRKRLVPSVLITTLLMTLTSSYLQLFSLAAYPLFCLYNGKRGKGNKFLFYAYYPIHLLILYFIA
ncbi:MAG: conjugal transfer protein TraX [Lachnospiraceae bacterium]|nr:conjugal transfer protein TraX [Lachnospiraceae bacterium]